MLSSDEEDSDFKDFEDSIQYFTTLDYKSVDLIVTRNTEDYKHSDLPVMTSDTLLKHILRPSVANTIETFS